MIFDNQRKFIEIGKVYNFPKPGCIVKRIHILAEIEEQIIYKRYSKAKDYWWYIIETRYLLDYLAEKGNIVSLKGKKLKSIS